MVALPTLPVGDADTLDADGEDGTLVGERRWDLLGELAGDLQGKRVNWLGNDT